MATQLVRIEHEDGIGMFQTHNRFKDGERREHFIMHHKRAIGERHEEFNTPWQDGLPFIPGEHFCAYKSIDQLQQWVMKDEFELLFKLGYSVYLIEVSDCQIGKDQIIFRKEDIVSKTNINQLFVNN